MVGLGGHAIEVLTHPGGVGHLPHSLFKILSQAKATGEQETEEDSHRHYFNGLHRIVFDKSAFSS